MTLRSLLAGLRRAVWPLALLAVCGAGLHCERQPVPGEGTAATASADAAPVDPVLLAFLSRARSAHHRADGFEEQNDLEAAVGALGEVIEGPVPAGPYPETREVAADTRARLADLRSRMGRFDEATRDLQAGLSLATERTYFRGHLFEVRGLVEERRSKALAEAGNESEAEAARKRALDAFEQAMDIQAEVIRDALGKERNP
jgi:tetratricopeptide (TPR) repeat protein